jgi:PAS domain-containing protein
VLYESILSQLRSRQRLPLDRTGLSSPSEDLDMAENDKQKSWRLLIQEAVRDTDTPRLQALIHELKKVLRERERPSPQKPQLVRAKLQPELLEFRHDYTRFRKIFDELHEFAGLLAPDGRLTLANRSSLEFIGDELETIFGKPLWELHGWDATAGAREKVRACVGQASQGDFIHYDVEVLGKLGPAWIDFSITPIRDSAGRIEMLLAEGKPYPQRIEEPIVEGEFVGELLRVEQLRRRISTHVVAVCACCRRIRDGAKWYSVAENLVNSFDLTLAPDICPSCEAWLAQMAPQGYRY